MSSQQTILPSLLARLLNRLAHYYCHPAYRPLWAPFADKAIAIQVPALGSWRIHFLHNQPQIQAIDPATGNQASPTASPPDIHVSGPLKAFLRLASTRSVPQAKQLGLCIRGDLRLMLALARILKNPPIDVTERLSSWIGDGPALRLGRFGQQLSRRFKQVCHQVGEMSAEYLQEEALMLPSATELSDWMTAVDVLRDDVARLSARLNAYQQSIC